MGGTYKNINAAKRAIRKKKDPAQTEKQDNIICKRFGCGKHLSILESMYSDYCFKHQLEIKQNQTV